MEEVQEAKEEVKEVGKGCLCDVFSPCLLCNIHITLLFAVFSITHPIAAEVAEVAPSEAVPSESAEVCMHVVIALYLL